MTAGVMKWARNNLIALLQPLQEHRTSSMRVIKKELDPFSMFKASSYRSGQEESESCWISIEMIR